MRSGYSFGGTAKTCRHCFEGLTGYVNVITLLGNHEDRKESRIREDRVGMTATRKCGLRCIQLLLGGQSK
jgi:hypothetical protein